MNGKFFVEEFEPSNWNINSEQISILKAGLTHEGYKVTWNNIISNNTFKDEDGKVYRLEEDKDYNLFMVSDETFSPKQ